ncbi:MAG: hypothetical protein V9G19_13455 [Tetrasphaera sp.]
MAPADTTTWTIARPGAGCWPVRSRGPTGPGAGSSDSAYESLTDWIHELLGPGFATEEEVRERVVEMVAQRRGLGRAER